MPDPVSRPLNHRIADRVLTTDAAQRARLAQALMASGLMAAAVVAVQYFGAAGFAPPGALLAWGAVTLGGMVVFWLLIRSGWSRRLADPTLTVPQMVFAIASGAAAYALVGEARGAVLTIVMIVLMLGMFVASPRQMRAVSLYAVAVFAVTMGLLAWRLPREHPWRLELGYFILVAIMMPAVSLLAGRLSRMRHRLRMQRVDLAQAVERIRQLATRDELTGLINRRHMLELLEQEHQRSVRSGRGFCVAMLDIDGFRAVNQRAGREAGDELLRVMALQAQRALRVSDVVSRWGGDEFLLMLADTRLSLARGGVERLREQLGTRRALDGGDTVTLTLSAGVVEHHAGETVAQTLDRAAAALAEAKACRRAAAHAA